MSLDLAHARLLWSAAQGLDAPRSESLSDTLARTGWIRTLGGVAGYLGLSARNQDATVPSVDEALAAGALGVSPAVRGCIYLVPRHHAALALRVAHHLSARRIAKEHQKLALEDAELEQVGAAVLEQVAKQPLSTTQLRKQLPDGTLRSLGAAGKKLGVTSTLPPALRRLEFQGRLRRQPVDARLDHERYVWAPHDLDVGTFSEADLGELARLYLTWAGPSTRKELAAWTGLNQTEAKRGLALCGADVATLGDDEVFLFPRTPEPTARVTWLPGMDNLYALRREARPLVDPAHAHVEVTNFGRGGRTELARMSQPIERTIVRDGEVIGLWAYDPGTDELVVTPASADEAGSQEERVRVARVLARVGHGRVFSLDTEARLTQRADRLRALRWP